VRFYNPRGGTKEETRLAGPDHAKIVIAVSRRNRVKADRLQGLHGA